MITSGAYRVSVRESTSDIAAALRRAMDYHHAQHEGTWLYPDTISLLASLATPSWAPQELKMVVVDLVRGEDNAVLAGCCGFSLGSAYHDYTMYTPQRDACGYGTFLTKLLGEALEACGYGMWYWGLRVGYMEQFENGYGAVEWERDDFYRRWNGGRETPPNVDVITYLRADKGMVPHVAS